MEECETDEYERTGSACFNGIKFQLGLLTIFLLNSFQKPYKWKLSTENNYAGKFDDVVIEWPKGAILLQSKFKENGKITLNDLLSVDQKNGFSLPKYFLSYLEIKKKNKIKKLKSIILCSNISVLEGIEEYLTLQNMNYESPLYCKRTNGLQFYKFNNDILTVLEEKSKSYFDNTYKGKDIEKSAITVDNLKNFLKHFQFYCNHPVQNGMEEVIDNLLIDNNFQYKISSSELILKVEKWYCRKKTVYLDSSRSKVYFYEINRDKYYQSLERYKVFFQEQHHWNKQKCHIVTETGYLLHELRIYNDLRDKKDKILYVWRNDLIEIDKEVLNAFVEWKYEFLVIIWPTQELYTEDVRAELNILNYVKIFQKIILVAEKNIIQGKPVLTDYEVIAEYVTLQTLSKDTKKTLLHQDSIVFQGKPFNLTELLSPKETEHVDLETLEKLVKKEQIVVGKPLSYLDDNKCYIKRCFERDIKKCCSTLKANEKTELCQDDIYNVEDKCILITSCPGMGKSTALDKIAVDLKEKYAKHWVIKIELKKYVNALERHKAKTKKNIKKINIKEFLSFNNASKLINSLEQYIFSLDKKVIILLDGIDEVSDYITPLITDLISECLNSPNIAKIFATTKSHATLELENKLEIKPFVLKSFTKEDQENFLKNYLKIDKNVCKNYIDTLITMFSRTNSIDDIGNHFPGIPLQAKIAAEFFHQWTIVSNGNTEINMAEITFSSKLLEALIQKKRQDYTDLNLSGNPEVSRALTDRFNKYLSFHEHIAVKVILGKTKCDLLPHHGARDEYIKKYVLKMGILQKLNNKFHFIYKKFAEYFFAKCVITNLIENQAEKFRSFFLEKILTVDKFKVVRGFIDIFLQGDSLNVCTNGSSLTEEQKSILNREGCQRIIQIFSEESRT